VSAARHKDEHISCGLGTKHVGELTLGTYVKRGLMLHHTQWQVLVQLVARGEVLLAVLAGSG
jgi:hypothetical protein